MGSGLGLSMHSPIRIATDATKIEIAEGRLGFFLGGAMGFFLSRLPDGLALGKYLALTGHQLCGMDAM